jgi:hypothetical protein
MSEELPKSATPPHEDVQGLGKAFGWVVCPACHQGLAGEAGGIRCVGCGRLYPVVDGIPVLLRDRAL